MATETNTTRRAFLSASGGAAAAVAVGAVAPSFVALPAIAEPLDREAKFKAATKAFKLAAMEYDSTVVGMMVSWDESDGGDVTRVAGVYFNHAPKPQNERS